jgi:hypothetical protein
MNDSGGAAIFYGTKDVLIAGCYGVNPWVLSDPAHTLADHPRAASVPKTERRVDISHEMDWVRACKESPESRVQTKSDFSEAGPFNEMVVMGVLAVRLQALEKELLWDGTNMQFTNINDTEEFSLVVSDDFKIENGHPTFNKTRNKINAKEFATELIKHNYQNGYSLPDMPK